MQDFSTETEAELLREARAWMLDCVWEEEPEELRRLPDNAVIRGVSRHYDGGWSGFVTDTLGSA